MSESALKDVSVSQIENSLAKAIKELTGKEFSVRLEKIDFGNSEFETSRTVSVAAKFSEPYDFGGPGDIFSGETL